MIEEGQFHVQVVLVAGMLAAFDLLGELRVREPQDVERCGVRKGESPCATGLCTREVHQARLPPKVVYSLTELGKSLDRALAPLGEWGETNMAYILGLRSSLGRRCRRRRLGAGSLTVKADADHDKRHPDDLDRRWDLNEDEAMPIMVAVAEGDTISA